jgi:hypothetical protein
MQRFQKDRLYAQQASMPRDHDRAELVRIVDEHLGAKWGYLLGVAQRLRDNPHISGLEQIELEDIVKTLSSESGPVDFLMLSADLCRIQLNVYIKNLC